jgi:N-acetylglucosaminyldiphosphoundecaprenol N-acetyl-beta-D-mannosaminyltransferase
VINQTLDKKSNPIELGEQKQSEIGRDIVSDIPSVSILDVCVHNVNSEQTLQVLKQMALSGKPHHIMTVNPEFIMLARRDGEFKQVLKNAHLVVPDGIGIVLAARILGKSLQERVTGVDTVSKLASVASDYGLSIFFLGAAPGIAEKTAFILQAENPGLKIAGTYSGSPDPSEENDICSIIENAHPHILLVAYGPPKQDLGLHAHNQGFKFLLPSESEEPLISLPESHGVRLFGCKP